MVAGYYFFNNQSSTLIEQEGGKSDFAIEDLKLISTYNIMNTAEKWHGTTIVLLRKNGETVVAGDGQVSLGNTVLKSKAKKVRKIESRGVIAGFAGSTADALTLFERLEAKLEKHAGNLQRAAVELCLLYTSPSPRDVSRSRMPSSA